MKAFGRALSDFHVAGKGQLPSAEQALLIAAGAGKPCTFACPVPFPTPDGAAVIRAEFLRFLLLGGDDHAPVHEGGIVLKGAFIRGLLDLNECKVESSFQLERCTLGGGVCLTDASTKGFLLVGCKVGVIGDDDAAHFVSFQGANSIFAERMKAAGSIFIMSGSRLLGQTRLGSASISGYLHLVGSEFGGSSEVAVDLDGAQIGTDLFLGHKPPTGAAGAVLPPTIFKGRVTLARSAITGDLFLGGAIMRSRDPLDTAALRCIGTTIGGALDFRDVRRIEGAALLGCTAGTLIDDEESWSTGKGWHRFNGFVYDRIADESRKVDRPEWLRMQRPRDLAPIPGDKQSGLRRQPWQQAAKVLEAAGDSARAKKVRVALEEQITGSSDWLGRLWRYPYKLLCDYGYEPSRLLIWTLYAWLLGALMCEIAAGQGQFVPVESAAASSPAYKTCVTDGKPMSGSFWAGHCALAEPRYPPVLPWLYSLDNLVPVIDLGQKKLWRVATTPSLFLFLVLELQYLFGFVFASALVATLGSYLVRRVG